MAWFNSSNNTANVDTRPEEPVTESRSSQLDQPQPRVSWVYRRMMAVFESSHRAPNQLNLSSENAAEDEVIGADEDENDAGHREDTNTEMTISSGESEIIFPNGDDSSLQSPDADGSPSGPDARQVSDSEASKVSSDYTNNDDATSESTRLTGNPKLPPQVSGPTSNGEQELDRERKRNVAKGGTTHNDSCPSRSSERKATGKNMSIAVQMRPHVINGGDGCLSIKRRGLGESPVSRDFSDNNVASEGHPSVDLSRSRYVGLRAASSTQVTRSSGNNTTRRSSPLCMENSKETPTSAVASLSQDYISVGDRKPAAIAHPMEILASKMSGKRKHTPETHPRSRAHLSDGLPLQIEFQSPQSSRCVPSGSRNKAKKGKHCYRLIYKTCRDKFPLVETENMQRTILPKDESYFGIRKNRPFSVAILSKGSAMMMDQLSFGLPKESDPSMLDIREMIGESVREALRSSLTWEFFVPDSGAYIKKELESMISLRDYIDECCLGQHVSVRIVDEYSPAVVQLNYSSEPSAFSGEREVLG